jgi:hypothetical protein
MSSDHFRPWEPDQGYSGLLGTATVASIYPGRRSVLVSSELGQHAASLSEYGEISFAEIQLTEARPKPAGLHRRVRPHRAANPGGVDRESSPAVDPVRAATFRLRTLFGSEHRTGTMIGSNDGKRTGGNPGASGAVESETQTATVPSRHRTPGPHPHSPARVEGDLDEARAIPTDVLVRKPGEPDAAAQMPAAAPSMTDEEAGADDRPPEGGIEPLRRRGD